MTSEIRGLIGQVATAAGLKSQSPREHFRTLHSPAGGDFAADGRGGASRHRGVPAVAGGAAAAGRLPDRAGHGDARRRQRRNHGVLGRNAAGAAARPDCRRHPDDLFQHARRNVDHGSIRPQPQYRPGGPGRAGGDHGGEQNAAANHDSAADLQEAQSRRCAHPHPCGALRHHAADAGRPIRRQLSRTADLASFRRRPGGASAANNGRRSEFRSIPRSSPRAD